MKKILVTGAHGVLGKYVVNSLSDCELFTPTSFEMNITDKKSVYSYIEKVDPTVIIHLAAMTNVDECEKNMSLAMQVNKKGTEYLVNAAKENKSFFIYLSTAAVFSGEKEYFVESDIPSPVNIYGLSKLKGEDFITSRLSDFSIIRAAWMIGGGENEKKFVSYIIEQSHTKKIIRAVNDKVGSITYTKELADFIDHIVKNPYNYKGIFHFTSKGICTRYDIAKKIVEFIRKNVTIEPVNSDYFLNFFSAPRPNREVLFSDKLKRRKTWEKSLFDYIQNEILKIKNQ